MIPPKPYGQNKRVNTKSTVPHPQARKSKNGTSSGTMLHPIEIISAVFSGKLNKKRIFCFDF
jgi:hypothetical protein